METGSGLPSVSLPQLKTSSEVELMETSSRVSERLVTLLKTSSEVELMETLQPTFHGFRIEKLKTSSEVELMETCQRLFRQRDECPSKLLLKLN